MKPRVPKRLLKLLGTAPRNCWLVLDLAEMKILGSYQELVDAVNEIKGIMQPLILWSPKDGFDFET